MVDSPFWQWKWWILHFYVNLLEGSRMKVMESKASYHMAGGFHGWWFQHDATIFSPSEETHAKIDIWSRQGEMIYWGIGMPQRHVVFWLLDARCLPTGGWSTISELDHGKLWDHRDTMALRVKTLLVSGWYSLKRFIALHRVLLRFGSPVEELWGTAKSAKLVKACQSHSKVPMHIPKVWGVSSKMGTIFWLVIIFEPQGAHFWSNLIHPDSFTPLNCSIFWSPTLCHY